MSVDKLNIRIIVQDYPESAGDFANRLETICNDILNVYSNTILAIPALTMTTASDGRQTATIQFVTGRGNNKKILKS